MASLTLLGGCSAQMGDFPSLKQRPYEKESAQNMAPSTHSPAILSAQALAEVNNDLAAIKNDINEAQKMHQDAASLYDSKLNKGRAAVNAAQNARIGSEQWAVAQVELSRLDAARAGSVGALALCTSMIVRLDAVEVRAMAYADIMANILEQRGKCEQIAQNVAIQDKEVEGLFNKLSK
ncbi:hypothetical protein LPB140_11955 [Sphingorhabdus lutea]|uniref:Uncharacterized protein n=1 Tax=Sphingorhabdus lutea TaxID=1913578 RepID=A0A1L3JE22_9SPHN|nr:hypothetical protein [Sphingorhabdus lutea]APG63382.1 hypothetical protein LPB140_11955 [Sphingorhabdus lutea]